MTAKKKIANYVPGMLEIKAEQLGVIQTAYDILEEDRFSLEPILVHFVDDSVVVPRRRLVWCLLFWGIYATYNIPIRSDKHIFPLRGAVTKKEFSQIFTYIYKELLENNIPQDQVTMTIWECLNEIRRFVTVQLADYQTSVSMLDLSEIYLDPEILKLSDPNITLEKGIPYIEKRLIQIEEDIAKTLGTKGALKNESMRIMQKSQVLNAAQVRHTLGPIGLKTDIDETIVHHYIGNSLVQGMSGIRDYFTEGLASRKNSFSTHDAIQTAQYFNRRNHLISVTLYKSYLDPCNSNAYLDFNVNKYNYKNLGGVPFIEKGKLRIMQEGEGESYLDKTIKILSPLTCEHTDGACKKCLGGLSDFISPDLDTGIISAVRIGNPLSQSILSTKHFVVTYSVEYKLTPESAEYLILHNDDIRFRDEYVEECENIRLGIPHSDLRSKHDLLHIKRGEQVRERAFSHVRNLALDLGGGKIVTFPLADSKEDSPYFTQKALLFLKSKYRQIEADDDYLWVPLKGLEKMKGDAFLKSMVVNKSIMALVNEVESFLLKGITSHTNVSDCLQDFSDMLYKRLDINIRHIAMLLKAYLRTDDYNFSIPQVKDPTNVRFGGMQETILNRTVSSALAFERLKELLCSPTTYTIPKEASPFDVLIGALGQ